MSHDLSHDLSIYTPVLKSPRVYNTTKQTHYEDQGALQTGRGQSCGEVQISVGLKNISETLNIPRSTIKSIIKNGKNMASQQPHQNSQTRQGGN